MSVVMAKAKMSAVAETKTDVAQESVRMEAAEPVNRQEIALLAYQFWLERGCPIGSPEEDWFRAEQVLQSREES
jgi:hypothetical protein